MASLIYYVDGKKVQFDDIPEGAIKSLFAYLTAAFKSQLSGKQCKAHHREPTIAMVSINARFTGYGFGACCQEFGDIIASLFEVNVPGFIRRPSGHSQHEVHNVRVKMLRHNESLHDRSWCSFQSTDEFTVCTRLFGTAVPQVKPPHFLLKAVALTSGVHYIGVQGLQFR